MLDLGVSEVNCTYIVKIGLPSESNLIKALLMIYGQIDFVRSLLLLVAVEWIVDARC